MMNKKILSLLVAICVLYPQNVVPLKLFNTATEKSKSEIKFFSQITLFVPRYVIERRLSHSVNASSPINVNEPAIITVVNEEQYENAFSLIVVTNRLNDISDTFENVVKA